MARYANSVEYVSLNTFDSLANADERIDGLSGYDDIFFRESKLLVKKLVNNQDVPRNYCRLHRSSLGAGHADELLVEYIERGQYGDYGQ